MSNNNKEQTPVKAAEPKTEKPIEAMQFPYGATVTRHSDALHEINNSIIVHKGDWLVVNKDEELVVMTDEDYRKYKAK